jgi:hypothetical protein
LEKEVVCHDRVVEWAVWVGRGVEVPEVGAEGVGEKIEAAVAAKILVVRAVHELGSPLGAQIGDEM